jgi:Spy/CpxP family protein refolding chaperone
MNKFAFVKTAVPAGAVLLLVLSAAPEWALGQSLQPGAESPAPMKLAPRGQSAASRDLLQGLTLTDEQRAKIDQIREETKSRMTAAANDKKLSPDVVDAFRVGYQRSENVKILEVLTTEQRQEVRRRIAAWRAAAGKPQYPTRPAARSQQTSPPQ